MVEALGGGFYVPIIKAASETTMKDNCALKILASNTGDENAIPLIESFLENPRSYVGKRGGVLLVVIQGLGVPATWDVTHKNRMETSKR